MTLIPDYLGICPRPMSLSRVEKLIGGTKEEEKEREYLTHSEFISDIRLIFANAIAYNNPDRVVEEVDRVSQSASVVPQSKLYATLLRYCCAVFCFCVRFFLLLQDISFTFLVILFLVFFFFS